MGPRSSSTVVAAGVAALALSGASGAKAQAAAPTTTNETYGTYTSATNVTEHARIALDIYDINADLSQSPPKYADAAAVYTGGRHSRKSETEMRTLEGMATKDLSDEPLYLLFVDMYGAGWLDKYQQEALEGTGRFSGKSDVMRATAAKKNLLCTTTMYASHELEDAIQKVSDLNDAKHNWDEGLAFWYGMDDAYTSSYEIGVPSAYEVSVKRDAEFSTNNAATTMTHFGAGLEAADRRSGDDMRISFNAIVKAWTATFIQATLKYAYKMQTVYPVPDKEWAEGYTYWRCMAGNVYGADADAANKVDALMDVAQTSPDPYVFCKVKEALEPVYSKLGLYAADIGHFSGLASDPCTGGAQEDYEEENHPHEEHEDYEAGGDDDDADANAAPAAGLGLGLGLAAAATAATLRR